MDKKKAKELIEKTFNNAFSEEQFTVFAKNLLNDFEDKHNHYSGNLIWDDYKEHINTYKRIGKYIDPDGEVLDVLIVEVKSVTKLERARTALRNFVIKHLSKFEKDYALVAYYSKEDNGNDWRFSFIKLEYRSELDEEKGKVKTKKEFTPAKRYSFLVGEYEKAHTAKNQLLPLLQNISNNPTIEELEAAFSIEKVTDEFFNQYKDLYIKLYEHFENDNKVKAEFETSGIDNARFTKKLLGQIVFLYFLQKKGWLGVAQNSKWGTGKKHFIQDLYEKAQNEKVNFFKDKLQYLFYEALAKERDSVNSYYKRFDCRIPFLNGGLFETDYNWHEANITIPENLFRNEEKNKAGDIGTGILDVFDRYNFTIKEDEPLDKEVAVDPEMLGKVFENMLDITERKSKGAFYTPREIVHYMCQESLIHYLDNALNNGTSSYQELGSDQIKLFGGSSDKKGNLKIELEYNDQILVPKKDIELYIREGHFALENDERVANKGETKTYQYQLPESIRKSADLIDQKLSRIKICDPAIGSGAFPVGLLHELVNAMLVLKPHFSYNYLTKKLKDFGIEHRESVSESRYIYRLKRHIIQESIYGVDIDASAIDIARLRLWLSLVVDEDDLDPIETLPNLDYKIVSGNSLIGLPDGAMRNLKLEEDLEALKEAYYDITDETKKKGTRQKINTKIRELLDSAEQFSGCKVDFDFKLFFSEVWRDNGGFDIVIGNPPYVSSKDLDNDFKIFAKNQYKTAVGQFDLFTLFIEKSINLCNNDSGINSFIVPDSYMGRSNFEESRKFFLKNTFPAIFLHFNNAFDTATVGSFIYISSKAKLRNKTLFVTSNSLQEWVKCMYEKTYAETKNFSVFGKVKFINVSKAEYELIDCLKQFEPLGKRAHLWRGEELGRNSEKIITQPLKDPTYYKIITGGSISKYKITSDLGFINAKDIDKELEKYTKIKVVIGQLGNSLESAVDFNSNITTQSVYNIISDVISPLYISAILNSSISNFLYSKLFKEKKEFPRILLENLKELPIPIKEDNQNPIIVLYKYCSILNSQSSEFYFFDAALDSLIFELFFENQIKSAGKEISKHLTDIEPIYDNMELEEKLAIVLSEFERLYNPNHPVRFAIETIDSVNEVRIIKESLK